MVEDGSILISKDYKFDVENKINKDLLFLEK